ncbi:MAG: ImmA/IrrE family metallo-endopeptidase [Polyangiaceae bacterium]
MASGDGASLDRETRFARAFLELHKLTPPVAIEKVLGEFADVEYDTLPCAGEAVVVSSPGRRPIVVVSNGLSPNRLRFTLAHELGHIVLPWQIGAAICYPTRTLLADGPVHADGEAQANRFARELLIPRPWLSTQLGTCGGEQLAQRIVEIAELAGVSPITAAIGLKSVYPFPVATRIVDGRSGRAYLETTPSFAFLMGRDTTWWEQERDFSDIGGTLSKTQYGNYTLSTLHFDSENAPEVVVQSVDAKSILLEVLWGLPEEQRKQVQSAFAGIVGHANNSAAARVSSASMLQALRQRFSMYEKFKDVRTHPRFEAYLHAKASELLAAPKPKKR